MNRLTDKMISNQQTKLASKVSASLHPTTGNLRLSILKDGFGWAHHFFGNHEEAVTFLEAALELVDPQEGGSDEN